ncbi:unnamed protein product [Lasius platythorax]|uniref:Uncharacterized protein n=1 Tax=Lasius platythorax TaxID=488582 RepID=A0AAV2NQ25_9HYME
MCPYSLSKHLTKYHDFKMYSEILSMGEASNSGSLLSSDKNIPISSMNPQPGSSKSFGIEVRDVDCDRDNTMGNLKRKLSNLSSSDKNFKDIGTSSGEPQAGSSKDLDTDDRDSGMKKVKYDDDNCLPDE